MKNKRDLAAIPIAMSVIFHRSRRCGKGLSGWRRCKLNSQLIVCRVAVI